LAENFQNSQKMVYLLFILLPRKVLPSEGGK